MKKHGKKAGWFIHYSYCKKSFPVCITARCVEEKCFSLCNIYKRNRTCVGRSNFCFVPSLKSEEEVKSTTGTVQKIWEARDKTPSRCYLLSLCRDTGGTSSLSQVVNKGY